MHSNHSPRRGRSVAALPRVLAMAIAAALLVGSCGSPTPARPLSSGTGHLQALLDGWRARAEAPAAVLAVDDA